MSDDRFVPDHGEVAAPTTVTTYPRRPMWCGFPVYAGTKGQFRPCGDPVEVLSNGLPTGRCSSCRAREQETRRRINEERAVDRQQAAGARRSYGGSRR